MIAEDDHSTDGCFELLERLAMQEAFIKVLRLERNQGKGVALRTALGKGSADIVLIQSADLEYEPSDYAALLKPISRSKAAPVFGSRFIGSQAPRVVFQALPRQPIPHAHRHGSVLKSFKARADLIPHHRRKPLRLRA